MDRTLTEEEAAVSVKSESSSSARKRIVVPDVRSDIYSTGATLYHLISGVRPARNATEGVPLSKKEFSPLVVKIITKAMNPNPDLRYQTAEEMLDDLLKIRERDPRVRRLKAVRLAGVGVLSLFLAGGAAAAFIGLKRWNNGKLVKAFGVFRECLRIRRQKTGRGVCAGGAAG